MSGKLALWRFDANEASLKPFQVKNIISGNIKFIRHSNVIPRELWISHL